MVEMNESAEGPPEWANSRETLQGVSHAAPPADRQAAQGNITRQASNNPTPATLPRPAPLAPITRFRPENGPGRVLGRSLDGGGGGVEGSARAPGGNDGDKTGRWFDPKQQIVRVIVATAVAIVAVPATGRKPKIRQKGGGERGGLQ